MIKKNFVRKQQIKGQASTGRNVGMPISLWITYLGFANPTQGKKGFSVVNVWWVVG